MNEELQSTNEALRSMNDQIQQRSEELRKVNAHLHSILGGQRAAVVALNAALEVELWSEKAHELWGLRGDEVEGKPFLSLDIGLPVDGLREPIQNALVNGPQGSQVMLDGVNRRGRPITCRVTCTPLENAPGPSGVVLIMEVVNEGTAAVPS
jgi:two-component system CheB/CheR fusion protein